jgi:cytochrome c oxidase assembly protein subunit 15
VAIWLWTLASLVFAMVVVGGATRLTESGLSITEWKPVTGVIPPINSAAWLAEFEKYKQIPQYGALFPDMDLAHFQFIYLWEWSHRLLGRLLGLALALPLVVFWAKGLLPKGLKLKLVGILALGGFQGFVGWWMVKSGLSERMEVAQERLALHLLLASLTFALLVWLAASLSFGASSTSPKRGSRRLASLSLGLVFLQIGLGALVAGLRAGRAYNDWPLMDGHFVPPLEQLTLLSPVWRNFVDNIATVQLQHRMVAYALLAVALVQAFASRRGAVSRLEWQPAAFAGVVIMQAAVGIGTLVLAVPLWAGLLHQAFAMLVLAMAVIHRQGLSVK